MLHTHARLCSRQFTEILAAGPNKAAKAKEEEEWRKPIPIDMKFGEGLKTRPPRNRPMRTSLWGWIIFLFYIVTFVFYAYCRIAHTLDSHDPAFAYQVRLASNFAGNHN